MEKRTILKITGLGLSFTILLLGKKIFFSVLLLENNNNATVRPPVQGDSPRALASDYLPYTRTNYGITILYCSSFSPLLSAQFVRLYGR